MSQPKRPELLARLLRRVLLQERPLYMTHLYIYVLEFAMLLLTINPYFRRILVVMGIDTQTSLKLDISRLLISVGVIILQLFLNVSIIRLTYPFMAMLIYFPTPVNSVTLLVTLAGISIDLCKASSTMIYMWNLEGETHSEVKTVYYTLHFLAIVIPDNQPWPNLLCILLCLILLVFRVMNPVSILSMQIAQEICPIGATLSLVTKCLVGFGVHIQLYVSMAMTVVGLLLYLIVRVTLTPKGLTFGSHSFQDLKDKGIYLLTMERAFNYLVGPIWDLKSNEEMAKFLSQQSVLPQLCIHNKQEYLLRLYSYLSEQKDQYSECFRYWSLMGQLQGIVRCNIPSLILTIHLMKTISQDYFLPRRLFRLLQINKLDQLLHDRANNLIERTDKKFQQDLSLQLFIVNNAFIQSCNRATYAYIRVWQSVRDKQHVASHLDSMIQQVSKVREQYSRLGDRMTKYSVFTYMEYLYLVERNLDLCHQICKDYDLAHFKEVDYRVFEKSIYICIGVEGDILKVNNAQVLGFRKSQLQGGHIDLLIPPFIRRSHSSMMADFFDSISSELQAQKIVNFNKLALSVNSEGYLRKVDIRLKACIIDFELRLVGIIQITSTQSFIAFRQSDHKIVGSSFCLEELSNSPIQALTDLTFDQVKKTLVDGQIQINGQLQRGMILSNFSFVNKMQVCQDCIWVISNKCVENSQMPMYMYVDVKDPTQKYPRFSSITNSSISEFLEKKDKLLVVDYSLKNLLFKTAILGFVCVVLTCSVGVKYNNLNELYSERVQYCHQISVMVTQTINTHKVLNYIYYTDFRVTSAVQFPDVNYADVSPISVLIVYVKKSFLCMHRYPASNITEVLLKSSHITNSFLLVKSVLVNIDWVLSMIQLAYTKITMPLVKYIEFNAITITANVLPYYQNLVFLSSGRLTKYNNLQLALTIVVSASLIVLAGTLLIFTQQMIRKQSYLNNLLFTLSDSQLENLIKLCRTFQSGVNSKLGGLKQVAKSPTSLKIKHNPRMFTEASLIQNSAFLTTQPNANDPRLHTDIDEILVPDKAERTNQSGVSYWFVGLVVCFILIMGAIVGASYHLNRNQQMPIPQYIESALALQSQYQSYMKLYQQLLDTLSLNSPPSSLQAAINSYNSSSSSQLQNYNETLFSNLQFATYQKRKGEFSFSPMCQFMKCDSKYIGLLNTTFSSSVLMSSNMITAIHSQMAFNPDGTLDEVQVSKSLLTDEKLNYLVYVAGFYSDIFTDLVGKLFTCMREQVYKYYQIQQTLYYTMISLSVVVTLVIGVIFVYRLGGERIRARKVLNLFHRNSYTGF